MQLKNPDRRAGYRLTMFAVALGLVMFELGTLETSTAWAFQQAGDGAKTTGEGGGGGGDAEATDESDAEAGGEAQGQESFLSWMIQANGWFFGPLLLMLSFVMVSLAMMNFLQVRRENLLPLEFIEDFEQKISSKDFQGAFEAAKNDDSFVARVLAAGLSKLNRGYSEAIEGMQEVGEDENMALEHRLSYLALIGSIAPMIGLMGTVYGMILTFRVIADSPTQPKPKELADGISMALFTTLEGLMVAIPAMICYSLLRNRVSRLVLEVGIVSEGLMSRFSGIRKGQQKQGGGSTETAPARPTE